MMTILSIKNRRKIPIYNRDNSVSKFRLIKKEKDYVIQEKLQDNS